MSEQEKVIEKITWKCANCGYTMENLQPPDKCPSCNETCEFLNVTCYTPDCGGPETGNIDPRLGQKGVK